MNKVYLVVQEHASKRIGFGVSLLIKSLEEQGFDVEKGAPWANHDYREQQGKKIFIGNRKESAFIQTLEKQEVLCYHTGEPQAEGFYLATLPGELLVVSGADDSGVLYGCQELSRILRNTGEWPRFISLADGPVFSLRGPAIGLQKTKVEPPRQTYEYPVTPERFPWFYDRALWTDFLDMLFEQRCNVIYIWSGHPFSSFVKLADYPEALEVTEAEYRLNVETFRWLTEEAGKRGIWIVLNFYNIHIPLPFAEKHGLSLHQPKPLPLTSDYYQKSISTFVRSFPNVGLMVCLGEALQGQIYGAEWLTKTILKGVNDGLQDLDVKEKPPIIIRSHAINAQQVMEEARLYYTNLYTEAKFNGESLTTFTPRGRWQDIHRHLGALNSIHIINVHILANLEPFRFGAPSFIQKCMQAAKYRLDAKGLHLYPLFFWDWPYSPDRTTPRLRQIDRDWIWYAAWFRYAWNPDRDPDCERHYWQAVLAQRYGDDGAGKAILDAYEASGECAPKILRRFGITEGNRQTMSLGMTMSQLVNPERYMPWKELWECQSPQGERLETYVMREIKGEVHVGETPLDIIEDVEYQAKAALQAIEKARAGVTRNHEEFERLTNDIRAIYYMVCAYTNKIRAAIQVLRYKHTVGHRYLEHTQWLEEAVSYVEEGLKSYVELTKLTEQTYLYANSMQTPQRKVPFPNGETYGHWRDCLPLYQQEFDHFKHQVQVLKTGQLPKILQAQDHIVQPYQASPFILHSTNAETYQIEKRNYVFTDGDVFLTDCAEELAGLTGIRFSQVEASQNGITLDVEFKEPSRILVGYFNSADPQWLQAPNLEENTHADERGGLTPILKNGAHVYTYPTVNVHAYMYEPGRHTLVFGKGAYLILGMISAHQQIQPRDVVERNGSAESMDWLFESAD